MPERRISVFLCDCGSNIAGVVDIEHLQEAVASHHYTDGQIATMITEYLTVREESP